jgi:hypothetical protein
LAAVVAHASVQKNQHYGEKMNEAPPSMKTRAFLIFCAVGLVPIALGYGAKPSTSLDALFGITVDTTNLTHIMRAVMGLYFGMVVIWVWGAFKKQMTAPALVSCAVFMLGLVLVYDNCNAPKRKILLRRWGDIYPAFPALKY